MTRRRTRPSPTSSRLHDEVIDDDEALRPSSTPTHTWKRKTVENFTAVPLLQPIFQGGECVYTPRALKAIRAYCSAQVETLWEEVTRFENPHNYYVDLSQKLWDEKNRLLSEQGHLTRSPLARYNRGRVSRPGSRGRWGKPHV